MCDNAIHKGTENHSEVRGGHLYVDRRIACSADMPIHNSVILGIDRGLTHRSWQSSFERLQKIAGTPGRVASWQHALAMFFQYLLSNKVSSEQDRRMPRDPSDWRPV